MMHLAISEPTDVELMRRLFIYFLIAASVVFALVAFFTFYYIVKYRVKHVDEEPPQLEGNQKMELTLGLIATALTALFVYLTFDTMARVQDIPDNPEPFLQITGHQWWWEAQYPNSGVITANQIHIPTGKRLLLKLNSADVIHSWWVPELGRKMDMIPGNDNYMWLFAKEEGEYLGTCSEFCGMQHAGMRIRVTALNPDAFKAWEQEQLLPVAQIDDSLFVKGKNLFETKVCTACHAITGIAYTNNIGPNLTHFASRKRFLADMLENNEGNLKMWLTNPQNVKPGTRMPNLHLSEDEVNALAAYIGNLK